jgi:hypothetical protein
MLTGVHKMQRMASALTFLKRYHNVNFSVSAMKPVILYDCYSIEWTHTHQTSRKEFNQILSIIHLMATVSSDRKGVLVVEFMQRGATIKSEAHYETLKNCLGHSEHKAWNAGIQCSAPPWQCSPAYSCSHSSTAGAVTLLAALISLRATGTCLHTWRTCWNHSASTVMSSWWNMAKRGWAHRRHTSLTQTCKDLFPNAVASIPAVTTLRSSWSTYSSC